MPSGVAVVSPTRQRGLFPRWRVGLHPWFTAPGGAGMFVFLSPCASRDDSLISAVFLSCFRARSGIYRVEEVSAGVPGEEGRRRVPRVRPVASVPPLTVE